MIIQCISCNKRFNLRDELLPSEGSKVRCGVCSEVWFYHPDKSIESSTSASSDNDEKDNNNYVNSNIEKNIDSIGDLENKVSIDENLKQNDYDKKEFQKENQKSKVSNFKIFGLEEDNLSEKSSLDEDTNKSIPVDEDVERSIIEEKNNKTSKIEISKDEKELDKLVKPEKNNLRVRRILFYFLFILIIIFSVVLVEFRSHIEMAYPILSKYFDLVEPFYQMFIKKFF
jgi:predicted Zn finger-like uncharacterized protein